MDWQGAGLKLGLQKKQLEPHTVLQVLERRNISIPQQNSVKLEEELSEHAGNKTHKGHHQWKYKVSDGETTLTAVEDESLVELHQKWRPGIKIVIVQPLTVYNGVIFVTRRDIEVLGDGLEGSALEENKMKINRKQQTAADGPPLFEPFDSATRKPDNLRFAGFDIDAFVFQGELRTINRTRRNRETDTLAVSNQQQEHIISIDEKTKDAMLHFLWNLQGKKQPQKPVTRNQSVDATVVAKQQESPMSVERGIQRLTNMLHDFTIKNANQREKVNSANKTNETNEKEAEEIMRSFYSSREVSSNHSSSHGGRRRGRGRGRPNVKSGGRGRI
ncbi:hypothetical protein Gasu_03430 isoform 2 [Galdieria sulphuraria]|uniref:RecQ-mediated genome instability protein 1 n=1 Tax=Galdieria sulphuraria TaxID=130081 RepID=M2W9J6_GALSU|nr:hypothetical protein Gasu_03430 isoform 2 [Galdieria sulphuraria]EME32571.1 hypothetical protein isoform 2 [Galdieria sulphuraria]|eukprot:XP_005709091.1 hypothetical protein isoform 2 [Galdieria sulphuraria]